jgi:glyoxylase-like metal-dependent hydrolase (beta-lactamase superfamily II)
MSQIRLGYLTIDRVVEGEGKAFFPGYIFPDADDAGVAAEKHWMEPNFLDTDSGRLLQGNATFVVRRPGMVLLVDTCVGNDKDRPSSKTWHKLNTNWMDQLTALGVQPDDVTHVFNTHLHVDHCGWNTRLDGDRWVPTFPNAEYLFPKDEFDFWANPANDTVTGTGANDGCYADSVLPVYDAGLATLIEAGGRGGDGAFWFESAAGHAPGQLTLHMDAGTEQLVFTGDLFHSPLQIARPEWSSKFDVDRSGAADARRQFIGKHGDADSMILSAHVCTPNAGRIVTEGGKSIFRLLKDL